MHPFSIGEVDDLVLGKTSFRSKDDIIRTYCCKTGKLEFLGECLGLTTDASHYHAQLKLPDKGVQSKGWLFLRSIIK